MFEKCTLEKREYLGSNVDYIINQLVLKIGKQLEPKKCQRISLCHIFRCLARKMERHCTTKMINPQN